MDFDKLSTVLGLGVVSRMNSALGGFEYSCQCHLLEKALHGGTGAIYVVEAARQYLSRFQRHVLPRHTDWMPRHLLLVPAPGSMK